MAEQHSLISLTGKWGNLIGYERNGKFYVRSMPEKVTQTIATRRASTRFGRYSRKAKLIRHAVYPDLDVRCDSTHVNRLNKLLIEAHGDHLALTGFRFNKDAGIDRFLTVTPSLSRDGILHIPAQEIIRHKGITALEVKAIAVRIDVSGRQVTGTDTIYLLIDAQQPFAGAAIPLYVPGQGTLILTLQVRAMRDDAPTNNKQFLAADIIAIVPPTAQKRVKVHTHPQQIIPQLQQEAIPSQVPATLTIIQRE